MSFYDNDRIRRKNAIYNIPDADINTKARDVISKCKSKGLDDSESKELILSELSKLSKSQHRIILETALLILKNS